MKSIKTAWHHIRRSPYQALAAVLLTMQTFFVISIFTYVILGSTEIIQYLESKPQVSAFFKDEAQQENIDALKDQLMATGKVSGIKFVSKQDALKIYKEQNKDDPLLLELVTEDFLPASFDISAKNIADLASISDTLKSSPLVSDVVFPKDVVAGLKTWTDAIRKIGVALIVMLAVDSVLVMAIIIGIKIAQKKEEIEIMRLIGATGWYIRRPFILEGILYGIFGAFLGWTASVLVVLYSRQAVFAFFTGVPLTYSTPNTMLFILGAELILAVMLGIFVSFFAVLRYLK